MDHKKIEENNQIKAIYLKIFIFFNNKIKKKILKRKLNI
jgi:hypothetical protein